MIWARAGWSGIVALLVASAAIAAEPPALTKFGQLPSVSNIALSPDGTAFAAMVGDEGGAELQLRHLPDLKLLTYYPTGRAKIRSLRWIGPDHLVLTHSTTARATGLEGEKQEWYLALDYNLKTRKWDKLLNNVDGAMNVVLGSPVQITSSKKAEIGIEGYSIPNNVTVSTLFRVNLDNHMTQTLDVGSVNTVDWVIGPDGRGVARADYRQGSGEWTLFVRPPGSSLWKRTPPIAALVDRPQLLGYGHDISTVLVSVLEGENWQTHEVRLADGNWSAPLADLDGDNVVRDRGTQTVIGSMTSDMAGYQYKFLAESDQKLWVGLQRAFPGETVSFAGWSDDRATVIVEVEGPKTGDGYFLVDRRNRKADWLANVYAGIDAGAVGERRVIHYRAADGLDIPAYLTLPPGRPAKALPLIVLPHGGPAARDNPGFDWWSQALASRGYVVLQPQFRGSDGFGTAHLAAGHGQWGRKMQTDLSDGVRQLVTDGIVDGKRVCIVGASYGGYAALAGVAFDPGVYRCAVAVAGVSDLRLMLRAEAAGYFGSKSASVRYWKRFMGAEKVGDTKLDAFSPALRATSIKVSVLLIHGKDDTVVPFEKSTVMADAMRKAGGNVELVTLAAEDHWLSRGATRIQMLEATVAFLEKNNPAIVQTAPK